MKFTKIVIFITLIFSISSIFYFSFYKKENIDFYKQIKYCFSLGNNADKQVGCMEDVYRAAMSSNRFHELLKPLSMIASEDVSQRNFYVCHKAGHNIGDELVKYYGGVDKAIENLNDPTCGFIHAPFDYFGRDKHNIADWYSLVAKCEEIQSKTEVYIQCDDAVGHAIVQSVAKNNYFKSSLDIVLDVCSKFNNRDARVNCIEGIIMERFGPLDPRVVPEKLVNVNELTEQCLQYPTKYRDSQEGCAYGVGWYLTLYYYDLIVKAVKFNDFNSLFNLVEEDCSKLGYKLSDFCINRFKSLID